MTGSTCPVNVVEEVVKKLNTKKIVVRSVKYNLDEIFKTNP